MDNFTLKQIEKYKVYDKDLDKTREIVTRYLTSDYGYISSVEELFLNLISSPNCIIIDYDLAEEIYKELRG